MDVVYKNLEDLVPYVNNPRNNDEAVDYVAASIKEFGFKVPIIVDSENVIVAGHTRYKAAKKLKMQEVPVIVADDLTPAQIKAFRLADNRVGEIATWNLEGLELELEDIDFDMSQFGFGDEFNLGLGDDIDDIDGFFADRESKKKEKQDGTVYKVVVSDPDDEATLEEFLDEGGYIYEKE